MSKLNGEVKAQENITGSYSVDEDIQFKAP
jgi:hypothetical protein